MKCRYCDRGCCRGEGRGASLFICGVVRGVVRTPWRGADMEGEGQGMWATLALLASSPGRHSVGEDEERVAEWLEALLRRIAVATQAPPPDPTPALRRKVLVSRYKNK